MAKVRVHLLLDDDAAALLPGLTTERRKGEFVSELIRQAATEQQVAAQLAAYRALAAQGEAGPGFGLLEQLEQRLSIVEEELRRSRHRR